VTVKTDGTSLYWEAGNLVPHRQYWLYAVGPSGEVKFLAREEADDNKQFKKNYDIPSNLFDWTQFMLVVTQEAMEKFGPNTPFLFISSRPSNARLVRRRL
jgi:hypothetical protein